MSTAKTIIITLVGTVFALGMLGGSFFLGYTLGINKSTPTQQGQGEVAQEYPYEFIQNMASTCIANGGSHQSCNCAADLLEKTVPYSVALEYDSRGELPRGFDLRVSQECGS